MALGLVAGDYDEVQPGREMSGKSSHTVGRVVERIVTYVVGDKIYHTVARSVGAEQGTGKPHCRVWVEDPSVVSNPNFRLIIAYAVLRSSETIDGGNSISRNDLDRVLRFRLLYIVHNNNNSSLYENYPIP